MVRSNEESLEASAKGSHDTGYSWWCRNRFASSYNAAEGTGVLKST